MRRTGWVGVALGGAAVAASVIGLALAGGQACRPPSAAGTGGADRPSIVLILTDDQRWDTLSAMPNVQALLARRGVTFSNAFVSNSLCCPSRASILTGRYAHGTGVWQNFPPDGGFSAFDDRSTVATWLQSAGYRTALVGKYLNRYESSYVPPGWDRWVAFAGGASRFDMYYRYVLNVDGAPEAHGGGPEDYSTTVLTEHAVDFICGAAPGPLFLYFAPYAPHSPVSPAPGDGAAPAPPRGLPASFDEPDVTDKPGWVRSLPRLSPARKALIESTRRLTRDTLMSVDRSVGEIVSALAATGRLQNTMIVLTSDNGLSLGEHRWFEKVAPYEESIRVPMVVRFDPAIRRGGVVDPRLVVNIDLAPTFAAAAGLAAPPADGRSFLPLLSGRDVRWRKDFLLEHLDLLDIPTFCGVRSTRHTYVAYESGEEELYDLRKDPYQLSNLAGDPGSTEALFRLRERARKVCTPPPPGFPGVPGRGS